MIGQMNPTQLSSRLAAMSDQQLQQYAMLHQDDPFVLAIASDVKNQRDAIRSKMSAPPVQQQPTVVQQLISNMAQLPPMQGGQGQQMPAQQLAQPQQPQGAPQQAADGGLMSGIARLPARNLAKMADGGITGYADDGVLRMADGTNPLQQYADVIRSEAIQQGVDPDVAMRLFMAESGGNPNAISSKGAVGLGQLKEAAAKEVGLSPEDRTDPIKNIQASIRYLAKQQQNYGGDTEKALAAYNWGPGNLEKHLQKNEGRLNRFGLPKETAAYINKILPIGTAEAAPQAAPPTPAGQIPGAAPGVTAPQAAPAQPEGSFSKLGKGVASLLDVATSPAPWLIKQVGYAASRPFMSPAEAEKLSSETAAPFQDIIGKTAGITQDPTYQNEASRRLAGFIGENLNKGSKWIANKLGIPEEDAANMVNTVAAAGPKAVSGIRQLPAAAEQLYSRVRPEPGKLTPQQINALAAEKRAAALEEARRDAMAAGATLEEQTALANMVEQRQQREAPSAAYELQQSAARPAPGRIATIGGKSAEQVKQAVPFARPDEGAAGLQNVPGAYNYMSPGAQATKTALRQYEIGQVGAGAPKSDVAAAAQAVDVAKQALPPEKRKGMGWEDLMMFGFALMAGKSPYAMQNIGTAGLAALQGKQEREKAEREERQTAGKQALEAAQAKYYEQYAGAIERGAKEKNDLLAAETLVQKRVGEWEKSLEGKMAAMQNPNARAQVEDALRRQIYGQLGLDVSKIAGAPATGDTGGFKVVGVRNP